MSKSVNHFSILKQMLENDPIEAESHSDKQVSDGSFLKAGQRIILMDSNERGIIKSLGPKATIELDDGLTIELSYGEFAVTNENEENQMRATAKHKKTDTTSSGTITSQTNRLTVDLHIESIPGGTKVPKDRCLRFQMEYFHRVLRNNFKHRGRTVEFIHGIGDGTLKEAIRKELDETYILRCTYEVGHPGVTVVTIR